MRNYPRHTLLHVFLFVVFLIVAVGLAAAITVIVSPIKMDLGEEKYTLKFLFHEESALYSELETVTLLDDSYQAKKINSYGGASKEFGSYTNDAYGEHFRLTFSENRHNYILLKRKDGSITVFNLKTKEDTASLYEKILEKIG